MSWLSGTAPAFRPEHCYAGLIIRTTKGTFYIESRYNGVDYWNADSLLWYAANDGYYLSDYRWTSYNDWYRDAKACTNAPANAHYTGPGTPDAPDGSVTSANDCPWECDDGYGNHNGECMPLCTGGATKFHAGEHVFYLWRDRYTAPSLNVELSGGTVCYINLMPGLASGTVNVSLGNQTYHVTN